MTLPQTSTFPPARFESLRRWATLGSLSEPDVIRYAATITVWGRWVAFLASIFTFAYSPQFWLSDSPALGAVPIVLLIGNGLVHYRLLTNRTVTLRWLLFLSVLDAVLTSVVVVVVGGFSSFAFLAYYPAVGVFAIIFPALWLSVAWTTLLAVTYSLASVLAGPGLDLEAGDETELLNRLAAMYVIAIGIALITRYERLRWRDALSRERKLRDERIELSQRIHDTTAQTAYMIDLGIHRARQLVGKSTDDLLAALDATSELSRSAMWEMRGPIDVGHIMEGRGLGRVLWSHCATYERITAIPTRLSQSGTEPALNTEVGAALFSVAHNALTNAFLHAQPASVEVALRFDPNEIRLTVSDDGVGLPRDYDGRGRGIGGMRAEAEQIGGTLIIESDTDGTGTTITCVVPR